MKSSIVSGSGIDEKIILSLETGFIKKVILSLMNKISRSKINEKSVATVIFVKITKQIILTDNNSINC